MFLKWYLYFQENTFHKFSEDKKRIIFYLKLCNISAVNTFAHKIIEWWYKFVENGWFIPNTFRVYKYICFLRFLFFILTSFAMTFTFLFRKILFGTSSTLCWSKHWTVKYLHWFVSIFFIFNSCILWNVNKFMFHLRYFQKKLVAAPYNNKTRLTETVLDK